MNSELILELGEQGEWTLKNQKCILHIHKLCILHSNEVLIFYIAIKQGQKFCFVIGFVLIEFDIFKSLENNV